MSSLNPDAPVWSIQPRDPKDPCIVIVSEQHEIADVYYGIAGTMDRHEAERTARLLTAAPDLLAALRNLVLDFDHSIWSADPMLEAARHAIEKATGEWLTQPGQGCTCPNAPSCDADTRTFPDCRWDCTVCRELREDGS